MSRIARFGLAAVAAGSLIVVPGLFAAPAYATTIDVAGHSLNFGNAVDENILENGNVGDSYTYTNVVTVNGVQVDALVTVDDLSDNSLPGGYFYALTQTDIDNINGLDSNAVDVPGCYSNGDYETATGNMQPYDPVNFGSGDLVASAQVEYIDGFEDDPNWEPTISTSLSLCDSVADQTVTGYVDIHVEFLVNGNPVTLTNLALNATDIDWGQQVMFWSPAPTTFTTSGNDSLVTVEDNTASDDSITFTGPADGSVDGQEDKYVGQVTYDSVSDFYYTFQLNDDTSGSLQLAFESYFAEPLASTGVDATPSAIAGLAVLGFGAALVVARRARRNRV